MIVTIVAIVVGIIAGFILLRAGLYSPTLDNNLKKMAIRWGAGIIVIVILGPSTIKGLELFGVIRIDRYEPTMEERKILDKFSEDKPSPEIIKEAKLLIEAAENRSPEKRSPEDYLALATEKWRAKNYDEALADVNFGLNLGPEKLQTRATLIYRKASIYQDLGLANQAIKFYKKAIELDSKFSWTHFGLGSVYSELGRLEEAVEAYNKAIQLDPDDADYHNNLGDVYYDHGKLMEAKQEFNKAIQLDPDNAVFRNNLGNVYFTQSKFKEAEEAYKKAIQLYPDFPAPYNNLGSLYQEQGKLKKAEEAYKKAIRLNPNVKGFQENLERVRKKMKDG